LGEVLFAEEKYREAAERFRHSLQSYVSHYNSKTGPENIEAVASGQLMSYILMKSEKYDEASRALRKELDRTKEVYGSESIQAADTMTNLATVLFYKNDFDESRAYYQRALAIYERLVAETSLPSNAEPLRLIYTCLGDINYIQGKDEDALNYYIKVEEMFFKSEKPEDLLSYIPAMKNLAMTHWRLDNADLAEPLFSRILDILKGHKKYGEGHSQTRVISEYLQRLNYGF
jgi:tetratricopeptide (TPR) repeat protein